MAHHPIHGGEGQHAGHLAAAKSPGRSPGEKVTLSSRKKRQVATINVGGGGTETKSSCSCCSCNGCCSCPQRAEADNKTTTNELRQNSTKQPRNKITSMTTSSSSRSRGAPDRPLISTDKRIFRLASNKNGHQQDNRMHQSSRALEPSSSNRCKLELPKSAAAASANLEDIKNCTKCLLIARFTTTQARLAANQKRRTTPATAGLNLQQMTKQATTNHDNDARGFKSIGSGESNHRTNSEISSLTASSLGGNDDYDKGSASGGSNWSLSSCYDVDNDREGQKTKVASCYDIRRIRTDSKQQQQQVQVQPSERGKSASQITIGHHHNKNKRRQAPLPPASTNDHSNNNNNNTNHYRKQKRCDITRSDHLLEKPRVSRSVDSGNTSETSRYCDETSAASNDDDNTTKQSSIKGEEEKPPNQVNLLSESEIYSIEHSLKSLKSSTYVCGCLANLYLTNTCLANNGRHSRPTSWQLSRTGVPVLTFDSGLARNRDKRRLCINLAERGSGFILWSDVIDHLSNYRAYSTQVDDASAKPNSRLTAAINEPPTCDTFHVMYLSSNHRLMVGLSFDDANCARLFLKQVELITSDPANISLTGPKRPLAKRTLSSMNRLSQLIIVNKKKNVYNKKTKQRRSGNSVVADNYRESKDCQPDRKNTSILSSTASMSCLNNVVDDHLIGALRNGGGVNRSSSTLKLAGDDDPMNGWSTLRRVMKFGQRVGRMAVAAAAAAPTSAASEGAKHLKATDIAPWLRPRPLAVLAGAGHNFKRLPRKCDISAPCLFEHVTRVDSLNLDGLYSRSLLAEEKTLPVPLDGQVETDEPSSANRTNSMDIQLSKSLNNLAQANECDHATNEHSTSRMILLNHRHRSELYHHQSGGIISSEAMSKEACSNDRSASSSCYSSASISPASSDESNDHLARATTPNIIRSAPPVPPMRRATLPAEVQSPPPQPPPPPPQEPSMASINSSRATSRELQTRDKPSSIQYREPAGGKVKAMIRELQSQTSSELVDAKRLLMADIAAQAAARLNRSVSHL